MCFPKYSKSDSQSGHRLGLSVLKVGALGFQSSHSESHIFLSCAMCAQILLSNSGSLAKPLIAWITRSFRSPVRMPLRPCKDPKSVCLAGLEGAMRATCPIHLACRLPTKILQSGTPNLRAHSSFVILSSRIFTQEIPSTSRIFPYQKLFSFLLEGTPHLFSSSCHRSSLSTESKALQCSVSFTTRRNLSVRTFGLPLISKRRT